MSEWYVIRDLNDRVRSVAGFLYNKCIVHLITIAEEFSASHYMLFRGRYCQFSDCNH